MVAASHPVLSPRTLNRALLAQPLLERIDRPLAQTVERVGELQAQ
jgi:hypothetical protein